MTRVKRGFVARRRHKKVLKITKGFRGALSKLYRPAHQAMLHSLQYMYRDRRNRKRDFRALWNVRINAGLRILGTTYSKFIGTATKKNVLLNRKILAELAAERPMVFEQVVQFVQA